MGYVPVIPPSLRVRPVPPQNQRGDKVGASIPPMIEMFNRGRMEPDDIRKLELSVDDPFRCRGVAVFWTPGVITVAILSLCLFSYGIGLWHGQMQGLVIAKAGDQLEKPE
jgi:hypothetical protein